jgi:hypothetical protein
MNSLSISEIGHLPYVQCPLLPQSESRGYRLHRRLLSRDAPGKRLAAALLCHNLAAIENNERGEVLVDNGFVCRCKDSC